MTRYNPSSIPASRQTCSSSIGSDATPTGPHGGPPLSFVRPTPEQLIATEEEIARLWDEGDLPFLTHLAGSIDGEYEKWLCQYFEGNVRPTDWVLASHRCHYHYQLHGGTDLIEKVLSGKSMFLHGPRFLSSAIVAGTCSIAAGLGLAIKNRCGSERVWNFVGDGAEDEGNFYEAVRFVHGRQLPVTFIIEDNDSSCGVTKSQRGSSGGAWTWPECVQRYSYTPRWPHCGTGVRPQLKWKPTGA